MADYISLGSHGVDARGFYEKFNVKITQVSRATGYCRATVSKLPVDGMSASKVKEIIFYLEELSIQDYEMELQECRQELCNVIKKIKDATAAYMEKEKILDRYRLKYGIKRKQPMAEQVTVWKVLKEVLKQ